MALYCLSSDSQHNPRPRIAAGHSILTNELRDSARQARIQVAETQKYEKEREKNRKAHSPNRGTAQNPGDKSVGRSEQLKTSGSSAQGGEQAPAPEQNHVHNEREAGAVPTQMEYEGKGENAARSVKPSKDTLGRHVTSGANGRETAAERADHVAQKRAETAAIFDSHTESAAALYKDLTDAKTLLSRRVSGAFITDLWLAHKPFDHQILLEQ